MEKNSSFFSFVIALLFAFPLAKAASYWMDALYRKNEALLPAVPVAPKRFRLPCLVLAFLISGKLLLFGAAAVLAEAAFPGVSLWAAFLLLILGVFLLLVITATDAEQQLIFDDTTRPLAALGLVRTLLLSYFIGGYAPLLENLSAAVLGGLSFLLLAMLTRGGIGGGDVKLIFALGLWLGPDRLIAVICAGLFLGGLAALFLLLAGQKKRKDAFAYGPCFTLPAILFLCAGLF
ncbi:MAG: prepilin peptidase [Schwartzia sp.]|nr:prepilin peptidase [Schwartzia sp. (in: firmicutes)]